MTVTAPKVLVSGNGVNGRDQDNPSLITPSKKTVQSVRLTPQAKNSHETSTTVFINTTVSESGSNNNNSSESQAVQFHTSQPQQVQKRVVTHVTIFPSPPPESAEVSLAKENPSLEKSAGQQDVGHVVVEKPPAQLSSAQFFNLVKSESAVVDEEKMVKETTDGGVPGPVPEYSSSATTSAKSSGDEGAALLLAKHWGPERLVEVFKEPNKSLGISIVGGKVSKTPVSIIFHFAPCLEIEIS